jgi:hypothetical protein
MRIPDAATPSSSVCRTYFLKQIAAANRTVEGLVHPIGLLIQRVRQAEEWRRREPEGATSFRASIGNEDYEDARMLWIEAVKAVKDREKRGVLANSLPI